MKKLAALFLVFCIVLTVFSGCNETAVTPDDPVGVSNISNQKEGTPKLAYSKADMLDPFTSAISANIQILGLIY
ncbi:MAG: hypothetical protein IJ264_07560, partial [Clostridia bacterium]|nr:hypothetical protein [Clostridia bacterium]